MIFLWRRTEDLSLNFVPYFLSAWCIFCSRLNNITSQRLFCYFFTQRGSGPWGRWHYQRHSEGQRNFEPFIKRLVHAILCFFWKRKEKGGGLRLAYTQSLSPSKESVLATLLTVWIALRTVPTIVIAHTFCASPDTRISYRQCLLIQGYFCAI